jgi:hypothetical protein
MRVCKMIKTDKAFSRGIHQLIIQLSVLDKQSIKTQPSAIIYKKNICTDIGKDFINPAAVRPQINAQERKHRCT